MNIAWMNDYKLYEYQGGATLTNKFMIDKGKELGHSIVEFTPKELELHHTKTNFLHLDLFLKEYDLIVLNNINDFKTEIIEHIIINYPYIKYEHDYCFCQYRSAQCETCKEKCVPAPIFQKLFANSKLNIFFSPLQLNIFKKFFGPTMRDAICIPAPMDRDQWFPAPGIQQDAYLFAGVLLPHKGINQVLEWADSQKGSGKIIHFAGKAVDGKILERIKDSYHYLGEIPHKDMPKLFRKYKYFVVNPMMPETFGLTFLEAMMSGCSIIKFAKSHTTGMESYNKSPTELIEMCDDAPNDFWKAISQTMEWEEDNEDM